MQHDSTPVQARGGIVSGRILLVLASSFIGAIVAVGLCWAFLLHH
jgi:hypothetical protein